jgi:hypothetical protein
VTVTAEGTVFVEDRAITDEQLDTALATHSRQSPVLVRADKVTRLERFVAVVDRIRGLGFQQVSLEVSITPGSVRFHHVISSKECSRCHSSRSVEDAFRKC